MPPKGSSKKRAAANKAQSKFCSQQQRKHGAIVAGPASTRAPPTPGVVASSLLAISEAALTSLAATTPREMRQCKHQLKDAIVDAAQRLTPLEEGFETIVVEKTVAPEQSSPQKQLERSQWMRENGGMKRLSGRAVVRRLSQIPLAFADALRTSRHLATKLEKVTADNVELKLSIQRAKKAKGRTNLRVAQRVSGELLKRYLDDDTKLFLAQAIVFNAFMTKVPLSLNAHT